VQGHTGSPNFRTGVVITCWLVLPIAYIRSDYRLEWNTDVTVIQKTEVCRGKIAHPTYTDMESNQGLLIEKLVSNSLICDFVYLSVILSYFRNNCLPRYTFIL
jgi:hypothetical protein